MSQQKICLKNLKWGTNYMHKEVIEKCFLNLILKDSILYKVVMKKDLC